MNQPTTQVSLYDRDFNLWIEDTVARLKAGDFAHLDMENLIEEIDSLGRRDKRELESRLQVLLTHLLKRFYVDSPESFRGWEITIREQRRELGSLLKQSPSLSNYLLSEFGNSWRSALVEVKEDYPTTKFPDTCPFPQDIDPLLSQRFWEN
jgi:hypothetical protein